MKPEISIIVPIYNVEKYLTECLNSILDQTFRNFELILINDGSTDCSGIICDEFAGNDSRIRVIHKDYSGVSSARNTGVAIAKGNYIGFVDSDDRIDKDMYKRLFELSRDTGSDIVVCKLGREIEGRIINNYSKDFVLEMDHINGLKELFKGYLFRFSLCNKLFKRSCFENIKFPEGRIHEDLATTYKLFANATKSVFTDYVGYIYIKRENSILTSNYHEKRLEAFIAWDEILSYMIEHYPELSDYYFASFVYAIIDHVHFIFDQVESTIEQKKYVLTLQKYVRKYFNKSLRNRRVSLKYKCLIFLLNLNPTLLSLFIGMGKILKSQLLKVEIGKA